MAAGRCPLCQSACVIKVIATGDDRYSEVDVCKMCGAMYPREGSVSAKRTSAKKPAKKKARRRSEPRKGKARSRKARPKVRRSSGGRKR